jgi:hypothetical protein
MDESIPTIRPMSLASSGRHSERTGSSPTWPYDRHTMSRVVGLVTLLASTVVVGALALAFGSWRWISLGVLAALTTVYVLESRWRRVR